MSTESQPEPQPTESELEPQSGAQPSVQPEPPPIQPIADPPIAEPPKPASTPSPDRPNKGRTFLQIGGQVLSFVATAIPIVLTLLTQVFNLLVKVLKWVWETWNAVLPKIRSLLPEPWKTRLPNQIFTAIALAFLLVIVSVPSWLSPDRSAAIARSDEPASTQPTERSQPAPAIDATKLAKIQERVVEVADQYKPGLVQSVKANPRQSRLTVTLDDAWYALLPDPQDKLANEVLKRSRQLKFDRLELTDSTGALLARSPMVGSTMLVLERVKADLASDRV